MAGADPLGRKGLGFTLPDRVGAVGTLLSRARRQRKKLTDWARQLVLQARRWLPGRDIVLVGDSGFAALELLATLARHEITGITRLRLDAALYDPAPPRLPGTNGRPRTKSARLPNLSTVLESIDTTWRALTVQGWYGEGERAVEVCSATAVWRHAGMPVVPIRWVLVRDPQHRFETQALLCTDQRRTPEQILGWFVQRWQLEVTLQETRRHLGVETQRQWSDLAIERTTPCLLGLFSLVMLLAARLRPAQRRAVADSTWYRKLRPNVQRHPRRRASPHLARAGFAHIKSLQPCPKTSPSTQPRPGLRHLPRRLMAKVRLSGVR